jgi:glutathione peroxidase
MQSDLSGAGFDSLHSGDFIHGFEVLIAALTRAGLVLALIGWASSSWASDSPEGKNGSIHQFDARRLSGQEESLSDYRGDVLLIVNTASQCGYTPQYDGLQELHSRYRERGFSVLGFPSNDFGAQEPGTDAEIGAFCKRNYGVNFPMFSKIKVRGEGQHPVYGYLTSLPEPLGGPVKWNFQKYLVDRSGHVVARYFSATDPLSPELAESIETLLERKTEP